MEEWKRLSAQLKVHWENDTFCGGIGESVILKTAFLYIAVSVCSSPELVSIWSG